VPQKKEKEDECEKEFNEFARLFLSPEDTRPEDIRLAAIVARERRAYDIPPPLKKVPQED
jgi:hypothetical protein